MEIKEILEKYKNIGVVGMSANAFKAAHTVPMYMYGKNYHIIPINPNALEISGMKVFQEIADVEGNIEILNVFRRSEDCLEVVEKAIERKKAKGDINVIWLQEGIVNDAAKKSAEDNGIEFVQDKCILKEYNRYF